MVVSVIHYHFDLFLRTISVWSTGGCPLNTCQMECNVVFKNTGSLIMPICWPFLAEKCILLDISYRVWKQYSDNTPNVCPSPLPPLRKFYFRICHFKYSYCRKWCPNWWTNTTNIPNGSFDVGFWRVVPTPSPLLTYIRLSTDVTHFCCTPTRHFVTALRLGESSFTSVACPDFCHCHLLLTKISHSKLVVDLHTIADTFKQIPTTWIHYKKW